MDPDIIRLFARFLGRVAGLFVDLSRDLMKEAARRDGKTGD